MINHSDQSSDLEESSSNLVSESSEAIITVTPPTNDSHPKVEVNFESYDSEERSVKIPNEASSQERNDKKQVVFENELYNVFVNELQKGKFKRYFKLLLPETKE